MGRIARNLKESVTTWPVLGSGSYTGMTFGTPVLLMARWENREELFHTMEGEEHVSNAIVYLSDDVTIGDYIVRGDQTQVSDPTTLDDAYRVRQFRKQADLRNSYNIRKAYL